MRSFCESSISSEGMKDIGGVGGGGCHRFADMLKNYTLVAIKYEMWIISPIGLDDC